MTHGVSRLCRKGIEVHLGVFGGRKRVSSTMVQLITLVGKYHTYLTSVASGAVQVLKATLGLVLQKMGAGTA